MSILLIRVEAPEAANKESSVYLDFDFVRTTSSLLQHVQQLAWDLLPGAEEIKATYVDDEGDACSLTEQTANDALAFAIPQGAEDTKILNITVRGMWAQKAHVADEGEQEPSLLAATCENEIALQPAGSSESVAAMDHVTTHCPPNAVHVFQRVGSAFPNEEEKMPPNNGPASAFAAQLFGRMEQGLHKEEQNFEAEERRHKEEQRYQEVQKLDDQRARMQSRGLQSTLHQEVHNQVLQKHSAILKAREDRAISLAAQVTKASPMLEGHVTQSASKESDDANQRAHDMEDELKTYKKEACEAKQHAQQCAMVIASYKKDVDMAGQQIQQLQDESSKCKKEAGEATLWTREMAEESVRYKKELVEAKLQLQELSGEIAWCKCELEESKKHMQVAQNARKVAEESSQEIAKGLRLAAAEEKKAKSATSQKYLKDLEQAQHNLSQEQKLKQEAQLEARCAQQVLGAAQRTADKEMEIVLQDIETLRAELKVAVERAEVAEEKARKGKWMSDVPGLSASVQSCSPLTLGVEAEDDAAVRGDATSELAELVSSCHARQAFRIGRIRLPAAPATASSVPEPACARVAVQNDGTVTWPETTVVVNVKGADMGLPIMALGALKPGEVVDVEMDLEVPSNPKARSEVRSSWAIVDVATGACLGPLLVFEAAWDLA